MSHAETLFVCTGNTGRSFMADVLANQKRHHAAFSRGIAVKSTEPEQYAIKVLSKWHLKKSHVAQQLHQQDLKKADWVLTMTQAQKDFVIKNYPEYQSKILTISECATGKVVDVLDPHGKDEAFYQETLDQIDEYQSLIAARGWICQKNKS